MRTTLKPAQILSISLLLFAVFFGAGNMIFPPLLGLSSERTCGSPLQDLLLQTSVYLY